MHERTELEVDIVSNLDNKPSKSSVLMKLYKRSAFMQSQQQCSEEEKRKPSKLVSGCVHSKLGMLLPVIEK